MASKKSNQQKAENLTAIDSLLEDIATDRATHLADKLDALTVHKLLEKVSESNGEVGTKSKAIISQIRMGMYSKIAEENAEAEAATVSDEDIERMKQRAFNPGRVLRAITSTEPVEEGDEDAQIRLLMGG